jgi:hypothetical protein
MPSDKEDEVPQDLPIGIQWAVEAARKSCVNAVTSWSLTGQRILRGQSHDNLAQGSWPNSVQGAWAKTASEQALLSAHKSWVNAGRTAACKLPDDSWKCHAIRLACLAAVDAWRECVEKVWSDMNERYRPFLHQNKRLPVTSHEFVEENNRAGKWTEEAAQKPKPLLFKEVSDDESFESIIVILSIVSRYFPSL